MNPIIDMLMNAAGGGAVQQIGQRFGLSEEQTGSALSQLAPAVLAGLQRNTAQEGGMEALLGVLTRGNHAAYVEDPEVLTQPSTIQDGNSILGHIFGSKDVSRAVASRASAQTGISSEILKQMLPMVAAMVMGSLSKGAAPSGVPGMGANAGFLNSILDQNRDGSVADDVIGMLGRFLGGR